MPYVDDNFLDRVRTGIIDAALASNQRTVRFALMALLTDIEESVTDEPPKVEPVASEGVTAISPSSGAIMVDWGGIDSGEDYNYPDYGSNSDSLSDIPF